MVLVSFVALQYGLITTIAWAYSTLFRNEFVYNEVAHGKFNTAPSGFDIVVDQALCVSIKIGMYYASTPDAFGDHSQLAITSCYCKLSWSLQNICD